MIKIDLARAIADKVSPQITQRDADAFLTAFVEVIGEAMERGERVQLAGFGVFDLRYVPEHQGRNPKTGEVLTVPACHYPIFKTGKALKDRVAKLQKVENLNTLPIQPEATTVTPKPARKKKASSAS